MIRLQKVKNDIADIPILHTQIKITKTLFIEATVVLGGSKENNLHVIDHYVIIKGFYSSVRILNL